MQAENPLDWDLCATDSLAWLEIPQARVCATLLSMTHSAQLSQLIQNELPSLIAIRHDLHTHPEIGLNETRTSQVIQRELHSVGIKFKSGLGGGTGVIAQLTGVGEKSIGLRADIDALPIIEETGLAYASQSPGIMHACGHDGHTTILIGVARVLAKLAAISPLPRPVTLLFQPAEENLGGATRMIADGCLTGLLGPSISEIYGLHCWPWLPVNSIGVRNGPLLASTDYFSITVHGRGSHAAWPHLSHDPVIAMAAIITALQTVVSRNTDPNDAVVVSVCVVMAGHAFNVIAQDGALEGTIRTLNGQVRTNTVKRIEEIVDHAARMHGCTANVKISAGCPPTVNHPTATDAVRRAAHKIPTAQLVEIENPFMGGEDFAFYGQKIPASFFLLGIQDPTLPSMSALHHPSFDFNDKAIATGIEAFCRLAIFDS